MISVNRPFYSKISFIVTGDFLLAQPLTASEYFSLSNVTRKAWVNSFYFASGTFQSDRPLRSLSQTDSILKSTMAKSEPESYDWKAEVMTTWAWEYKEIEKCGSEKVSKITKCLLLNLLIDYVSSITKP